MFPSGYHWSIKSNYDSPTDLTKKKSTETWSQQQMWEFQQSWNSEFLREDFKIFRLWFFLPASLAVLVHPCHVRPAASWGHVQPPDRNSLVHYKHRACLSLEGGCKHGPGLSKVGKGSLSLHVLRPSVTQDIVVYAIARKDSILLYDECKT